MQIELKEIQRRVGITFVFVTHDQEEALTLSDRVAVFNEGVVEQIGTPEDLYERPATRFVASFLGTTNLIEGALAERLTGRPDLHSVRPEHIRLLPLDRQPAPGTHGVAATVREVVYTGPATRYAVETDDGEVLIALAGNDGPTPAATRGDRVRLEWDRRFTYAV
nr:ABC transporter ATP-binding protein [Zhihengliuella sp.]